MPTWDKDLAYGASCAAGTVTRPAVCRRGEGHVRGGGEPGRDGSVPVVEISIYDVVNVTERKLRTWMQRASLKAQLLLARSWCKNSA